LLTALYAETLIILTEHTVNSTFILCMYAWIRYAELRLMCWMRERSIICDVVYDERYVFFMR